MKSFNKHLWQEKGLPDTFSGLIKLALDDLKIAEQSSKYKINMNTWFKRNDGVCQVCLAGCVLAISLEGEGGPFEVVDIISDCDEFICKKLFALDEIRKGNLIRAYSHFIGKDIKEILDFVNFFTNLRSKFYLMNLNREWPTYRLYPDLFKLNLEILIEELEKEGL